MKKILLLVVIVLIVFVGVNIANKIIKENNSWKVEITNSYINVRTNHSPYEAKISTVYKGEKYKIIEMYLEDDTYVWYKIMLKNNTVGWIASGRNDSYVKEFNNPNTIDTNYKVDYAAPVLKFQDETYETKSIDTINFHHLTIKDDSDYEIKYNIYIENHPTDRPGPQYWIKYTVIDIFGNTTSKVQRIKFEILPSNDKVLDFSKL